MKNYIFIANNNIGYGLSGGDRIFIELMRYLSSDNKITIFASEEANDLIKAAKIANINIIQTDVRNPVGNSFTAFSLIMHQLRRTLKGTIFIIKYRNIIGQADYIYSVSDFVPDVVPAIISIFIFKKLKWICALYFFAANPFSKNFPYKDLAAKIRGSLYYFGQRIIYKVILKYAYFVVLCNEVDKKIMVQDGFPHYRTYVIYGGVDLEIPRGVPEQKKTFEGVYMARFHPQKGPIEAVNAWKFVTNAIPQAKLAMIGGGHEKHKVEQLIEHLDLQKNIILYDFMDGEKKYKLLKSAKLFIHSAIYETGGMAAAEGMAAGLPVVAFDHKGFDYCYPKGLVKAKSIGDPKSLATVIIKLLEDEEFYNTVKKETEEFIPDWDWKNRAQAFQKKLSGSDKLH